MTQEHRQTVTRPGRPPHAVQLRVTNAAGKQFNQHLIGHGVEASEVHDLPWGRFVYFSDPDGNGWALQQIVRPPES